MKYVVSSAAQDDLLAIWAHSVNRWDEDQADLYIDAIIVRFAWLMRNSGLWHKRPELGPSLFSYPEKSHVIFFMTGDDALQVLRVLHVSMDVNRHLDP